MTHQSHQLDQLQQIMHVLKQQQQKQPVCCPPPPPPHDYVALNETGIDFLNNGMFDSAISVFRMGLQIMAKRLEQRGADFYRIYAAALLQESDEESPYQSRLMIQTSHNCSSFNGNNSSFFTRGGDKNTLVLHTTPFNFRYIHPNSGNASCLLESDPLLLYENGLSNLLSGILLFNLALSLHLRATALRNKPESEYRQIQELYIRATQALQRNHLDPDIIPDVDECRVLCAVYNNMAHISYQCMDIESTCEYLNTLQYLLALHHSGENGDLPFFRHPCGLTRRLVRISQHDPFLTEEEDTMLQHYYDRHFLWNVAIAEHITKFASAA